jgi:hypothetical protein
MRERFGRLKDMKEGREFIFFPPPPSLSHARNARGGPLNLAICLGCDPPDLRCSN